MKLGYDSFKTIAQNVKFAVTRTGHQYSAIMDTYDMIHGSSFYCATNNLLFSHGLRQAIRFGVVLQPTNLIRMGTGEW